MGAPLSSIWFDGHSPRAQACTLRIDGAHLVLNTDEAERRYPLRAVRWPERRAHGMRHTGLPDGSLIQHADAAAWDDWWQANGHRDRAVVRWMQSWRTALLMTATAVACVAAAWLWGVPWAAHQVARAVPAAWEARLGDRALAQLNATVLAPSTLSPQRQDAWRQRFQRLVSQSYPAGDAPAWRLHFHHSRALGPNALALPGGHIVITDQLVELLADRPDALMGVMAHELGHLQHRDGLDMLVRASLVGALAGVVLGDAGGFVAAVPATLVTQSYSRDAERRADAHAAQMLHAAGVLPEVMAVFFERLPGARTGEGGAVLPIAIGSHPGHADRAAWFRDWPRHLGRP